MAPTSHLLSQGGICAAVVFLLVLVLALVLVLVWVHACTHAYVCVCVSVCIPVCCPRVDGFDALNMAMATAVQLRATKQVAARALPTHPSSHFSTHPPWHSSPLT